MKKITTIASILICMTALAFGQIPETTPQDALYTIDFVFTGEVQSRGDSIFTLRYSFVADDVQQFNNLLLEDSQGLHQLSLKKEGRQTDMEVKNEKGKVNIFVFKYDKYDLPVPVHAEDSQGIKHRLYLITNAGGRISAEQFKAQLKGIREMQKQEKN